MSSVNNKKIKYLSIYVIVYLLITIIFCYKNEKETIYQAATIAETTITETTRRKSKGSSIEGAEYYEELWEKNRVIAVDNGGGMGEGGGADGDSREDAGNSGKYDDSGGVFGDAAGSGLGSGSTKNQTGTGAGSNNNKNGNGSTGSSTADALRALKSKIEESKAESIAKQLETADDVEKVRESIKERESIQASIQKKLTQDRIRARIVAPETTTRVYDELPPEVAPEITAARIIETRAETIAPTMQSQNNKNIYDDNVIPTARIPIIDDILDIFKIEPTTTKELNIDIVEDVAPPETIIEMPTISDVEPGDFIEANIIMPTVGMSTTYAETILPTSEINEYETDIVPTATMTQDSIEESTIVPTTEMTVEETMVPTTVETIATYETNDVESNTTETIENTSETYEIASSETDAEESKIEDEEGEGSKGGDDANAYEDKEGDGGSNEKMGDANEKGEFQLETKGEFSGKKVFEIEITGNVGIEPDHLSVTNMNALMTFSIISMFLLGILLFLLSTRDKKDKHNYF